jgi:hypothetical protein
MAHASFERVQPLTSKDEARSDDRVVALGTAELVGGIVEDARDLLAAHVEALRDDISARLVTLGSMLIAIVVFAVTVPVLCLAVAASLNALGVAWWIALWIVTLAAAAIGVGFLLRARRFVLHLPTERGHR